MNNNKWYLVKLHFLPFVYLKMVVFMDNSWHWAKQYVIGTSRLKDFAYLSKSYEIQNLMIWGKDMNPKSTVANH